MGWLKTVALGALLTGASIIPGYAFNMLDDLYSWTKDPTNLVNFQLGMPKKDVYAQLSYLDGWERHDFSGRQGLDGTAFRRKDDMDYSKVPKYFRRMDSAGASQSIQREIVGVTFKEGKKELDSVYLSFEIDMPKSVVNVTNMTIATSYGTYLYSEIYRQLCETIGRPTRPDMLSQVNKNGQLAIMTVRTEWDYNGETYGIEHIDDYTRQIVQGKDITVPSKVVFWRVRKK